MTTTWEQLVASSTLETGTALDHLQAQGQGGEVTVFMVDGMSGSLNEVQCTSNIVELQTTCTIDDIALSADLSEIALGAVLESETTEATVTEETLSGEI